MNAQIAEILIEYLQIGDDTLSEEEAKDLRIWLNGQFRGYGYNIEAEAMINGGWKVEIYQIHKCRCLTKRGREYGRRWRMDFTDGAKY